MSEVTLTEAQKEAFFTSVEKELDELNGQTTANKFTIQKFDDGTLSLEARVSLFPGVEKVMYPVTKAPREEFYALTALFIAGFYGGMTEIVSGGFRAHAEKLMNQHTEDEEEGSKTLH